MLNWGFLVAQSGKNLPSMQETWVRALGWEDPLEKDMATQSSIPAWRIPWTEEPSKLTVHGSQRVRHNRATKHSTVIWCLTEFIGLDYDKFLFSIKLFSHVQSPNHVRQKQN